MANVNEFTQPASYLNGGPFLTTWGPYLTKEAACEALKNEVDADGKNMRSGKTVAIGTVTDYVEHAWIGGFENFKLKPVLGDLYTKSQTASLIADSISKGEIFNIFGSGATPFKRYKNTTDIDIPPIIQTPTADGLEITGMLSTDNDSQIILQTAPAKFKERIIFEFFIRNFKTTNPAIGIAFGTYENPISLLYRANGQFIIATPFTADTFNSSQASYGTGDTILMEIVKTQTGFNTRLAKNGAWGNVYARTETFSGFLAIANRGGLDFRAREIVKIDNPSNAYTDQKVSQAESSLSLSINQVATARYTKPEVDQKILDEVSLKEDNTLSVGMNATDFIIPGTSAGVNRTRIDALYRIPALGGTLTIEELQVPFAVAGKCKVVFSSLSGNTNPALVTPLLTSNELTVLQGLNTFSSDSFAGLQIPPNSYVGFSVTSNAELSVISPAAAGSSYTKTNGQLTSPENLSVATYKLQFNLKLKSVKYTTLKEEVQSIKDKSSLIAVHVSNIGSDTEGDGSILNPYKTINRAIIRSKGSNTRIICAAGDYMETIDYSVLNNSETICIEAASAGSVVRILGSDKVTSWSKVSGKNNIYVADFSKAIPGWNGHAKPTGFIDPIFEDKNPSEVVTDEYRNPLDRGVSHWLPFTPIYGTTFSTSLDATLTILDSTPGRYYHDTSAGKLYLHASNSSNPLTNGFSYEIPQRDFNKIPDVMNYSNRPNYRLDSIQLFFARTGWSSSGFGFCERHNCTLMGVAGEITAGGFRDDGSNGRVTGIEEVAFVDGDGHNGHYNVHGNFATQDLRAGHSTWTYENVLTHHCFDDGMSHHERSVVLITGWLVSILNKDRGFVPAQGCQAYVANAWIKGNGFGSDASGQGVAAVNTVLDGTNGTKVVIQNGVIEGNRQGVGVLDDVKNKVILGSGVIVRNNTQYNFNADKGVIVCDNIRATNMAGATMKREANGGVVIVKTDALLS